MASGRLIAAGIVVSPEQLDGIRRVIRSLRRGKQQGVQCWCPDGMLPESLHHNDCVDASLLYDDICKLLGKPVR